MTAALTPFVVLHDAADASSALFLADVLDRHPRVWLAGGWVGGLVRPPRQPQKFLSALFRALPSQDARAAWVDALRSLSPTPVAAERALAARAVGVLLDVQSVAQFSEPLRRELAEQRAAVDGERRGVEADAAAERLAAALVSNGNGELVRLTVERLGSEFNATLHAASAALGVWDAARNPFSSLEALQLLDGWVDAAVRGVANASSLPMWQFYRMLWSLVEADAASASTKLHSIR